MIKFIEFNPLHLVVSHRTKSIQETEPKEEKQVWDYKQVLIIK